MPSANDLPESLDLTLDGGHSTRRCRLVWRKLNKTGVEFLRRRAIATRRMAVNFAKLPGLLNNKN